MALGECAVFLCVLVAVSANAVPQPESKCEASVLTDHYKHNQSYDSFEPAIRESIQTTKNLFKTDELSKITDIAAKSGLEPVVGSLRAFLPILKDALAFDSEWKLNFAKSTLESSMTEAERAAAESSVEPAAGKLRTALAKMEQLNDATVSDEDRRTVVKSVDAALSEVITAFKASDILHKYPLLVNKALISLGLFVPMFHIQEKSVDPELFSTSRLACDMLETVLPLRAMVIRTRLENIETPSWTIGGLKFNYWQDCWPEDPKKSVCEKEYGKCGKIVQDILEDQYKMYEEFVPFLMKTCSRQPSATGLGWFIVELGEMKRSNADLDPTFKILVGGVTKFEQPESAKAALNYGNNFVYQTERIQNTTDIIIEVWDSGKRILFQNVPLLKGYYSIRDGERELKYSSYWIPEKKYE